MTATRRGGLRPARTWRARSLALLPWAVALAASGFAAWAWMARPGRQTVSWQYIGFGDSLAPSVEFPSLALSPDGSDLAITDNTPRGQLWIKRRGLLRAVPIPRTDGARRPVYSPDGRSILFIAGGHLKTVRLGEGAPIDLADSAWFAPGGATWLDDRTIVYVGPTLGTMSRVAASGGPSTVILRDSALAGLGLGSPAPLPGRRGVLFTACGPGCVIMNVRVLDLRTGRQHVLLDDAIAAWYLPTGHLLCVRRDGSAFVARFDLDQLAIAGPPVEMLHDVRIANGSTFLTWSTAGALVFIESSASANEAEVVRVENWWAEVRRGSRE